MPEQSVRPLPRTAHLPYALYRAAQVRAMEQTAIKTFALSVATLMERAGAEAFDLLRARWPACRQLTVLCGLGNNAGDAYVVARLAQQAGFAVSLVAPAGNEDLPAVAAQQAEACRALGLVPQAMLESGRDHGVIIDGLFGIGLNKPITGLWADLIAQVNALREPVLALDLPSGLHADTGVVMGVAMRAEVTLTFIGLKQGLFTGAGPEQAGEIVFSALDIPARLYATELPSARRLDWARQRLQLQPLSRVAHKGECGHLLLVGGAPGMSGALLLASEAAARTGTGVVTMASCAATVAAGLIRRPEIMAHEVHADEQLQALLARATAIVLGPGLGRSTWAERLFAAVLTTTCPLVIDADGLRLLAQLQLCSERWILTPHLGEAASLLDCSVQEVQADRFAAAATIQHIYGGVVVLKGAGTLIAGSRQAAPGLCSEGNPGMASAGMGDVLAGVIGGLLAQGYSLDAAAEIGVTLHAAAGDHAAQSGLRSLLAADLFPSMRALLG